MTAEPAETDLPAETTIPADWRPRASRAVPFLVAGALSVVVGGLAAAVTGPTDWEDGSWVAAYLVLVSGVGQVGLGAGQAALAPRIPSARLVAGEWVAWNLGNLVVVAGTLFDSPAVVSLGGVGLVAGLAGFASGTGGRSARPGVAGWRRWAFLGLVTVLLVSIPVGLALSWRRS